MGLRDLLRPRYDGAIAATLAGIADRVRDRTPPLALDERDRLDGRTCLVTGANRGLGLAVSIELARRGGHVLLACRSGIPEVMDVVRRESGGGTVEAIKLDLADLGSVESVAQELAEDGVTLDVTVLNAGIVPERARKTIHGLDEMFQVNFLSNVLFARRLVAAGVIPTRAHPLDDDADDPRRPRVLFVSSESHRTARPLDFPGFGVYRDYGMREVVGEYGYGKLLLETFASELSRRIGPEASVHTLCPGAVRTGIAREAPSWAKPMLDPAMRLFFKAPEDGAVPVVWLAASRSIEGQTGLYVHVKTAKPRAAPADDPNNGERIWRLSDKLLGELGFPPDSASQR